MKLSMTPSLTASKKSFNGRYYSSKAARPHVLFREAERNGGQSNISFLAKAWIAGGKLIAADPNAIVACPVCGDGNLVVEDIAINGTRKFERVMRCPNCSSRKHFAYQEEN
jgi:hypothetical protein